MEIRIYTESGSVETFFQENPALVTSILKAIQSTKVFANNVITIAGDYSVTTFATSRVNRVDLVDEDLPVWKTGGISNFFSAIGSLAGGGEKVAAGAGGVGGGAENTGGGGGAGLGGAFGAATEAIASLTAELGGGGGTSALGAPLLELLE